MNPYEGITKLQNLQPVGPGSISQEVIDNLIKIREQLISEGKLTRDGRITDEGRIDPTITDPNDPNKTIVLNQQMYYTSLITKYAPYVIGAFILYKFVSK